MYTKKLTTLIYSTQFLNGRRCKGTKGLQMLKRAAGVIEVVREDAREEVS